MASAEVGKIEEGRSRRHFKLQATVLYNDMPTMRRQGGVGGDGDWRGVGGSG
jgi:hypothetical protein